MKHATTRPTQPSIIKSVNRPTSIAASTAVVAMASDRLSVAVASMAAERYPPADTAVIQVHIQLHGDGCHQNPHRQQTEVHRLRVQDLLHGGLPQLHAHQQDQSRHYQP